MAAIHESALEIIGHVREHDCTVFILKDVIKDLEETLHDLQSQSSAPLAERLRTLDRGTFSPVEFAAKRVANKSNLPGINDPELNVMLRSLRRRVTLLAEFTVSEKAPSRSQSTV